MFLDKYKDRYVQIIISDYVINLITFIILDTTRLRFVDLVFYSTL